MPLKLTKLQLLLKLHNVNQFTPFRQMFLLVNMMFCKYPLMCKMPPKHENLYFFFNLKIDYIITELWSILPKFDDIQPYIGSMVEQIGSIW